MERQLFRAACLTLILGTVLSCVASDTTGLETEADFKTTIPKEGLQRDLEQVFSLGPSSTLQVIDETGKAVYLPEPSQSVDGASSGPYSAVYRFDNGACDFSKTIEFKDAFPGYTKPLWVHEDSDSVESGKVSVRGPVRYTFTNPPEEYLGGGLSFCVRFKTVVAAGSDAETSTSTPSTAESSGSGGYPSGELPDADSGGGDENPKDQTEEAPAPPSGTSDKEPAQNNPGSGGPGSEQGQDSHHQSVPAPDVSQGSSSLSKQDSRDLNRKTDVLRKNVPESSPLSTSTEKSAETTLSATENGHEVQSGKGEDNRAPLRRLADTPAVKEAYLTVVVHSAAWGSAGGMGAPLGLLLTAVATGLHFL
ncbi:unnamed protein product [Neospora caninum Liverpool]|uniref:Toxoplasma gondii family A protein n=1 Tax=Neospora caninum (strain Liverpool) TaxID=572307 RepID=F0VRJ2_NEOCL|nr:uncharacterized protein NCLIV_067650 [Neospora caninum Liverpool]CBZ56340.1 unnamed protein product [Neospora caninum Liverpool]CEL71100.1 TPA: hypothetical protein BN1204_067650 [Neospora caninum Liverpool]|eukprot:XP_003886365.1 uncharacterized protein NCLIV_067650 [Neospora caninum Liverpool]